MIYNDFLGPYPPPVKYLFGKPIHDTLLTKKTRTELFWQEMVKEKLTPIYLQTR